ILSSAGMCVGGRELPCHRRGWEFAMARTGRPKAELVLTDEERTALERLVRRRKSAQAMAMRARIVLRCADGLNNREVAEELGVSDTMVGKWRRRFVA